jgi:carbonic anhydrase
MLPLLATVSIFTANLTAGQKTTTGTTATDIYNYKQGGSDWHLINPLCKAGKKQSPIDLVTTAKTDDVIKIVSFNYVDFRLDPNSKDDLSKSMNFPD